MTQKHKIVMDCGEPCFNPPVPIEILQEVSHQGRCDDDVADFIRAYDVTCDDAGGLARWLADFGAWSDKELLDHRANIERACWIMAGDCIDHLHDMGAGRCGIDRGYLPPTETVRLDIAALSADVNPGAEQSFQADGDKWGYVRLRVCGVDLWVCGPVLARIAKIAPIVDALYIPPADGTPPSVRLTSGTTTWTLYHQETK